MNSTATRWLIGVLFCAVLVGCGGGKGSSSSGTASTTSTESGGGGTTGTTAGTTGTTGGTTGSLGLQDAVIQLQLQQGRIQVSSDSTLTTYRVFVLGADEVVLATQDGPPGPTFEIHVAGELAPLVQRIRLETLENDGSVRDVAEQQITAQAGQLTVVASATVQQATLTKVFIVPPKATLSPGSTIQLYLLTAVTVGAPIAQPAPGAPAPVSASPLPSPSPVPQPLGSPVSNPVASPLASPSPLPTSSPNVIVGGPPTVIGILPPVPLPSGASTRVTWTSDNPQIATVSNGLVKAVATGNATITATVTGARGGSAVSGKARIVVANNAVAPPVLPPPLPLGPPVPVEGSSPTGVATPNTAGVDFVGASFSIVPNVLVLDGTNAPIIRVFQLQNGQRQEVTSACTFTSKDVTIVKVNGTSLQAVSDGATTVTVSLGGQQLGTVQVSVQTGQ